MKSQSLFKVLVLGGALMVGGSALAQASNDPLDQPQKPEEVFCSMPDVKKTVCVTNSEGKSVPKAGFTCCWNTTCED